MSESLELDLTVEVDGTVSMPVAEADLHALAVSALEREGHSGEWQLSILFTSDPRMQEMHLEFMGLDSPTDIMTFPYEDDGFGHEEVAAQGGDVVISVDTARENAAEHGWTVSDELLFLELHGILHILGWDDTDPEDRRRMLERQRNLLDAWRSGEAVTTC